MKTEKPISNNVIKISILKSFENKTGINSNVISLFNKAFIALLLSTVIFTLCYLLKSREKNNVLPFETEKKEESEEIEEIKKEIDFSEKEPDLPPAAKSTNREGFFPIIPNFVL